MMPIIEVYTQNERYVKRHVREAMKPKEKKPADPPASDESPAGESEEAKAASPDAAATAADPDLETLTEKVKQTNNFIAQAPLLVTQGNGNVAFQFQKNYIMLVYYSLIQFRNYQANNFNILFLILASYIVKHQVNYSFIEGLQQFTPVILRNFSQLKKTDELELFFGKCGRNAILEAPSPVSYMQDYLKYVVPNQSQFMMRALSKNSVKCLTGYLYERYLAKERGTAHGEGLNSRDGLAELKVGN